MYERIRPRYLVPIGILIAALVLWVIVPFYYLIVTSLTPAGQAATGFSLPKSISFEGYRTVIFGGRGQSSIWPYMINSIFITACSIVLSFLVSLPAAYGLSRLRAKRAARTVYLGFLGLQAFPTIALVVAFFLIYAKIGLLDSRIGLTVAMLTIAVPFQVWVLKAFFDAIPSELESAGALDGAGPFAVFYRIVLPMMSEAIAATAMLSFLNLYVDYIFAVSLTSKAAVTIPVYVAGFKNELAVDVAGTCAAAVVSMIPMIFLYVFAQRYMKRMAVIGV